MKLFLGIFLFALATIANAQEDTILHPDTGLNTLELIEKYGFVVEQHPVVTEDGYIVEMHRIPHGRNNKDSKALKPPVLIMHGMMSSSADFVNFGEKSLAFILAELGYDVWLGNARGNFWSRKHVKLDPDTDNDFWKFSWHEIGVYDLPACIDYILDKTFQPNLFYIGHSQGGTSFYVMASEKPEYNSKIRLMSGLGPAAYTEHIGNVMLKFVAYFLEDIEKLAEYIGLYEFLPITIINDILGQEVCVEETNLQEMCDNIFFLVLGYDSEQLNSTLLNVIITNAPSGTSTRQPLHYGQGVKYGHFRQYDFGVEENLIKYGQETPPDYDLGKITAPVATFYSANDLMVSIADLERLHNELGNVVKVHLVDFPMFNHIDFLWANDVVPLVYDHVIKLMSEY